MPRATRFVVSMPTHGVHHSDAPKQLAIPHVVACLSADRRPHGFELELCHTPFRQPTPEYSIDSPDSTLHRTLKPMSKKSNIPDDTLDKIRIRKSFFESAIDVIQDRG